MELLSACFVTLNLCATYTYVCGLDCFVGSVSGLNLSPPSLFPPMHTVRRLLICFQMRLPLFHKPIVGPVFSRCNSVPSCEVVEIQICSLMFAAATSDIRADDLCDVQTFTTKLAAA